MSFLRDFKAELASLAASHRLRSREEQRVRDSSSGWVDVSSNDYLRLGAQTVSRETLDALAELPTGAGASRLIHGTHPQHVELERELASWVRHEDALLFSSGYAANVGLISAIAQEGDLVVSDALNHASTIDGCRLSRAQVAITPHRDVDAVARALQRPARRRWVLTETYFSMEADSPDLQALRACCDRAGAALIVDEAHALGVFGPEGAGLCAAAGVQADILVGTLGKALGVQGAFVAAPRVVTEWLWNRARSFVFSTAPSPLLAGLLRRRVGEVRRAEQERHTLARLAERFTELLRAEGLEPPASQHGPIFPVHVGADARAREVASHLRNLGFLTQAIRPPTVPEGTSRLRVALHAQLTEGDLEHLAKALGASCRAS